ncbi:MAG: hypothetical protein ABI434_13495 [Burkholderiaceae bacterium]
MVTTARGFPRFLPTLTEVVHAPVQPPEPVELPPDPALLEAARREAEAAQCAIEAARREAETARREAESARRQKVVERLRGHVLTAVDERIQDIVAAAMLEQVDLFGERLRRQMDDMVRESFETVAGRLRAELEVLVDEAVDAVLATPDLESEPELEPQPDPQDNPPA